MNLYLCSTIRHILFALTKALNEPNRGHHLLVSVDQQNIKADDFNLNSLPPNIQFTFFKRDDLKKTVQSDVKGKMIWFAAQRQMKTTPKIRRYTQEIVFSKILNLNLSLTDCDLYLFNDRNHVARLLRLGFESYFSIEDGLSSYGASKLKWHEKLSRKLSGSKIQQRYFGDDPRCREIYFLNIDKAPQELLFKAKLIDWIDFEQVQEYCFPVFGVDFTALKDMQPYIIATQPVSQGGLVDSGVDLKIYQAMVDELQSRGIQPSFKVHPREPIEKFQSFEAQGLRMLPAKVPLELLLLGQQEKVHIFSIYSSAGMGFERFCQRHTFLPEQYSDEIAHYASQWIQSPSMLQPQAQQLIQTLD